MSTANLVKDLEIAKKIVRYKPDGNRKARRCLFLTAAAAKEYNDDQSPVILLAKRGPVKNAFDHWTLGSPDLGTRIEGCFHRGQVLKATSSAAAEYLGNQSD